MSGAVSSGKTFISNLRWYKHIFDVPDRSLLVAIGKTTEALRDNVINPILKIDNNMYLDEKKIPMRLVNDSNGVEVACAGANNERSWQSIQGKTTAGALFDEVTNQPQTLVQNVCKGCRQDGKQWPKFMTCNPDAPGHYIKKNYIDNAVIDKRVWYFGLLDNPSLTDEYREEVKQLYTGALYDRMILGKWVQAEGVVFDEFDRDRHLFTEVKNTIKEYIISIDWGYTNPLAIQYIAVDYDSNYYVLDEFYETKQLIDETLKAKIIKRGWLSKSISYGYADTNRPDCINSMNKLMPFPIMGAIKDVADGINAVNSQFKQNKLFVHANNCHNTLQELESYVWKQKKGNELDEPIKDNDHLMDALRYAIFTRERSRVRIIKSNPFSRR